MFSIAPVPSLRALLKNHFRSHITIFTGFWFCSLRDKTASVISDTSNVLMNYSPTFYLCFMTQVLSLESLKIFFFVCSTGSWSESIFYIVDFLGNTQILISQLIILSSISLPSNSSAAFAGGIPQGSVLRPLLYTFQIYYGSRPSAFYYTHDMQV